MYIKCINYSTIYICMCIIIFLVRAFYEIMNRNIVVFVKYVKKNTIMWSCL